MKRFGIHEGAFGFEVTETEPAFSTIPGFLEKQNGKWGYRDYHEMLEKGDENMPMKLLRLRKCKYLLFLHLDSVVIAILLKKIDIKSDY